MPTINYEAVVWELELFIGLELYMHPEDKDGSLERMLNHIDTIKQKHTLPDSQEEHCCGCELKIEVNEEGEHVWVDGEYIAREYVPCTKRAGGGEGD